MLQRKLQPKKKPCQTSRTQHLRKQKNWQQQEQHHHQQQQQQHQTQQQQQQRQQQQHEVSLTHAS
ncbi:hypothetical protein FHG87_014228 [Trinorchestia longiramus]|nr:hypothetical protein FHG87_014228 [Trinorchestia longiramus]